MNVPPVTPAERQAYLDRCRAEEEQRRRAAMRARAEVESILRENELERTGRPASSGNADPWQKAPRADRMKFDKYPERKEPAIRDTMKMRFLYAIALSDLSATAKAVAAVLIDKANKKTGRCFPSLVCIAFCLPQRKGKPVSTKTISRAVKELERGRWFSVSRLRRADGTTRNEYHANIEQGFARHTDFEKRKDTWKRGRAVAEDCDDERGTKPGRPPDKSWQGEDKKCPPNLSKEPKTNNLNFPEGPARVASRLEGGISNYQGGPTENADGEQSDPPAPPDRRQGNLLLPITGKGYRKKYAFRPTTAWHAAEGRWTNALCQHDPELVALITPDIEAQATQAEMQQAGAGFLKALKALEAIHAAA